jgi:hypothetical protein
LPRPPFDADALLKAALRGEVVCREFGIHIDREGRWHYRGSPISRMPLVKLFASVLRRAEDGSYWLVTPGEQGRISVEDVPFTAIALRQEGTGTSRQLAFRTNLDEWATLDAEHPLRVMPAGGGAAIPYLTIRNRLEARIGRAVYYELAELAEPQGQTLGVWSGGRFWALGPADG